MMSLSSCHASAITLFSHLNPALITTLDLDLDLIVPPYLSLSTVSDIFKLISDDDRTF
jgi:hypothetical protein